MKTLTPRLLLPAGAALLVALALTGSVASADGNVIQLEHVNPNAAPPPPPPRAPVGSWSRKLWTGSFDRASDASEAAAHTLDGMNFGDCERFLAPPKPDPALRDACVQRQMAAQAAAVQAHGIAKQQSAMSLVSKASDLAAVGAVGATIYGEMGVKTNNQVNTYEKAAHIEETASKVSYVTGAADLTMGVYAYVAQKKKLEAMRNTVTGTGDGMRAPGDPGAAALTNAAEAAKKAAISHIVWGAGKIAAGYGMKYLSKKSQEQADRMQTLQDLQLENQLRAMRNAQNPQPVAQAAAVSNGGAVPFYQNNAPTFSLPNTAGASGLATHTGPVSYTVPGGGTGSSVPLTPAQSRALASAAMGKVTGGGGGGGGADGKLPESEEAAKEKAEKTAKEAMGSSFETQLTGGVHSYGGNGAAAAAGKDEIPNLANLMGNGSTDPTGSKLAATGLSPMQLMQDAQDGAAEQGSMAGVSGKSEVSLFEITKAKLTKMNQIGNVGIPKNVEVRN